MQHLDLPAGLAYSWPAALIAGAFWVVAYLSPTIMAYTRRHQNRGAILLMNLFLGWTLLGWITALVWAATSVERPRRATSPTPVTGGAAERTPEVPPAGTAPGPTRREPTIGDGPSP